MSDRIEEAAKAMWDRVTSATYSAANSMEFYEDCARAAAPILTRDLVAEVELLKNAVLSANDDRDASAAEVARLKARVAELEGKLKDAALTDAVGDAEQAVIDALTAPRDFNKAVEAAAKAMWESMELRLDSFEETELMGPLWMSRNSFKRCAEAALPHLTGESELVGLVKEWQEMTKHSRNLAIKAQWLSRNEEERLYAAEDALLRWGSE